MSDMPKVSIVMPVYNVEQYLRECIESVVSQTLKDIEIICVNDGSTDGSLAILQEFAEKDSRIKIISKANSGYGHSMNVGMDAATGEFIGIVETDDYVPNNMYERLYNIAKENQVDIIKADFSRFTGDGKEREFFPAYMSTKKSYYNRILNPQDDPRLLMEAFYTWAGIYSRKFLNDNNIRHNETPGASYQDNGFYFQTFACAKRLYLLNEDMYKLRRDNPNSSINNKEKVFCVCDEFDFIYTFLCKDETRKKKFAAAFYFNKFRGYYSTYKRIAFQYKLKFLERFSKEFNEALLAGDLNLDYFTNTDIERYRGIVNDYVEFFYSNSYKDSYLPPATNTREELNNTKMKLRAANYKIKRLQNELNSIYSSAPYRIGSVLVFLPKKIRGGIRCIKENGMKYTVKHFIGKVKGKFK